MDPLEASRIQEIPRTTLRLSACGRPPSGDFTGSGIRSASQSDCCVVSVSPMHSYTSLTGKSFGIGSSLFSRRLKAVAWLFAACLVIVNAVSAMRIWHLSGVMRDQYQYSYELGETQWEMLIVPALLVGGSLVGTKYPALRAPRFVRVVLWMCFLAKLACALHQDRHLARF